MKRISFLVVLMGLFLFTNVASVDLGIKKSTETISFFLLDPLDSTGVARKPDSAHVLTYADNASAATFTATSTTYPFSDISIDTLKIYGDTIYVFSDAIADIDGAGGNFQLAIEVKLFCNTLPTPTHATVQITADSLNVLATINDSLEAYDGWVATSAKQTLVIDTVNAVLDTLQEWDDDVALQAAIRDTVNAVMDSLQLQDGWVATSANQTLVIDTVNAVIDTLQNQDGWVAQQTGITAITDTANAILDTLQLWDDEIGLVTAMRDTINAIVDSLQSQDGWVAQHTSLTAITDTTNAILDTLQLWDDEMGLITAMRDTINAIVDTLQNQDGWIAQQSAIALTAAGVDAIWDEDTTGHGTAQSFAVMLKDTSAYQGAASGLTKAQVADTVWTFTGRTVIIEDTLTTGDSVGVMPDFWSAADSTAFQGDVSAVGDVADTVNAILDTLQLWDTSVALLVAMRDSINGILDTLQLQDGWVAQQTEVANFDGWDPHLDNDSLIIDMSELSARPAIGDTIQRAAAVPGNAMALTTAERGHMEDSVYAQRADYKADVSGMALDVDITTLQTSVTDIASDIDSLSWWLGAEIGSYSYTHLNTGADTMWIVNSSDDTLSLFIFFHPGGAAGDPPDSFKVVAP